MFWKKSAPSQPSLIELDPAEVSARAYTSGSHIVTVKATDSVGHVCAQTASINVGVQGVQVNVTSPAAGATVNAPVTVTASATSTHTITGWHIYVDNVDSFSAGQVNSISASLFSIVPSGSTSWC